MGLLAWLHRVARQSPSPGHSVHADEEAQIAVQEEREVALGRDGLFVDGARLLGRVGSMMEGHLPHPAACAGPQPVLMWELGPDKGLGSRF